MEHGSKIVEGSKVAVSRQVFCSSMDDEDITWLTCLCCAYYFTALYITAGPYVEVFGGT